MQGGSNVLSTTKQCFPLAPLQCGSELLSHLMNESAKMSFTFCGIEYDYYNLFVTCVQLEVKCNRG